MKRNDGSTLAAEKPAYAMPTITTLTETEVLEAVGPAQAYTGQIPFQF